MNEVYDGLAEEDDFEERLSNMGFQEMTADQVKVGDEVAYITTMFEFPMNGDILVDRVTSITRTRYGFVIRHGGHDTEVDEEGPVWVRR